MAPSRLKRRWTVIRLPFWFAFTAAEMKGVPPAGLFIAVFCVSGIIKRNINQYTGKPFKAIFSVFSPRCSLVPLLFSQRYCFANKLSQTTTYFNQMRTNALNSLSFFCPSPDVASAGAHSYRNCALSPPLKGRSGTDWRISGNSSGISS